MKVLVIGGGFSGEREISLRSANAVFEAINPEKHEKFLYDWDGSSEWLAKNAKNYDVALPILHGEGGEDGMIQAILEENDIPYLGSGVATSQVCIDKKKTQAALQVAGVTIPQQAFVNLEEYLKHPLSQKSHVLKPATGGSSLDTYVLTSGMLDEQTCDQVFAKYDRLILEEYIDGVEVTVPVLEGYDLPLIKIVPPDEFFNFQNKYDGTTQEICNPDDISEVVQKDARALAKRCHEVLGCRHLSRVDIIIRPDQSMYVLEVNTIPGLTNTSLFPKAAAYIGMSMPELVEYFIGLASRSKITS